MDDNWKDERRLIEELGRLERESDPEGRWRRRTYATASAEEDAERRAAVQSSEQARLDDELFRPLGEDFHARVVQRLAARQQEQAPAPESPAKERFKPAARSRRHFPPSWLAAAAVLVLAVGAGLVLRPRGPALPDYTVDLDGMEREERSSPTAPTDGVRTFIIGGRFDLTLRPTEKFTEELRWRYFLQDSEGHVQRWKPDAELAPNGAVKIEGTIGEDIDLPFGNWTLIAAYGTIALPEADDLDADAGRGWRVLRIPLQVRAKESLGLIPTAPVVEYAGCYATLPGPTCIPYSELRLWARSDSGGGFEVTLGDLPLDIEGIPVDGGWFFSVPVSATDGALELRETTGNAPSWRLELRGSPLPPWLKEASDRVYQGETEGLAEELVDRLAGSELADKARVHSILGRISASEDERQEHLKAAAHGHQESGHLLEMTLDFGHLMNTASRQRNFPELSGYLDELASALGKDAPAEASFELLYNRGLLESGRGNIRGALSWLRESQGLARRTGMAFQQSIAEEKMGLVLQELGRYEEALDLFEALPKSHDVCSQVRRLSNHAWALIQSRTAGTPTATDRADPLALLDEGLALAQAKGCDERSRLHLLINKALALVGAGQTAEGLRALADADPLVAKGSAQQHLWIQDIQGRLALLDHRGLDALSAYVRMEELAISAYAFQDQWLALVGQARAHHLLADIPAALLALEKADVLLDEGSLNVPLHERRDVFVARREVGSRFHIELLLRQQRVADALAVARRSRARVLRSLRGSHRIANLSPIEQGRWDAEIATYFTLRDQLDEEATDDWRLVDEELENVRKRRAERGHEALAALDRAYEILRRGPDGPELPRLPTNELVLAYYPLANDWVGFASFSGDVRAHRFELPDHVLADVDELSRRLLEPFRREIAAATRLRVLPYGVLRGIDFHALPWAGEVLLAHAPVVYSLDLRSSPDDMPTIADPARPGREALVIADPRLDLPAAEREGLAVAGWLRAASWHVGELNGTQALAATVRRQVQTVDLLHYAGHGVSNSAYGWTSALELALGTRLTLGDLLALETAPRQVVLSSCEGARTASEVPLASLGLGQAFLVAGSQEVVAAVRQVADDESEALFRRLYSALDSSAELAAVLRQAQLAWRDAEPGADWASFRVLVP